MINVYAGNKQQYNLKPYKEAEPDMKDGKSNIKLGVFQFSPFIHIYKYICIYLRWARDWPQGLMCVKHAVNHWAITYDFFLLCTILGNINIATKSQGIVRKAAENQNFLNTFPIKKGNGEQRKTLSLLFGYYLLKFTA